MTGLHEFLTKRYREERERQQRIYRNVWEVGDLCPSCQRRTASMRTYGGGFGPLASFEPCQHEVVDPEVMRQFEESAADPAVLADLDAKDSLVRYIAEEIDNSDVWWYGDKVEAVLQHLALPYAGHPGYREEWKP